MLKDNLAMLRNIHGFSQEELAEKINISRQAYAKWERGDTIPDIEKCSRLAEIYGVSIDSLVKTEKAEGIGAIPPAPRGKNAVPPRRAVVSYLPGRGLYGRCLWGKCTLRGTYLAVKAIDTFWWMC